jgi:hypothetical protein
MACACTGTWYTRARYFAVSEPACFFVSKRVFLFAREEFLLKWGKRFWS